MPLILHLSDLHLVPRAKSQLMDDHGKVGLVRAGQRETLFDVLLETFSSLRERLKREGRKLDAIVMSGDVAHQNSPAGYTLFLELLKELDGVRPGPECTVVVPGNHDVDAGRKSGNPKRYKLFADHMRGARFVTPLLQGVDTLTPSTDDDLRRHMVRLDDLEIVPINTSDYAQVQIETGLSEQQWKQMKAALSNDKEAQNALQNLRIADAARVSPQQMASVKSMLETAARLRDSTPNASRNALRNPLRIGVLHHQLLPVSDREEVKGFESFTNLGRLRQFLVENDIAIVLHGHKHEAVTYIDYVPMYDDPSRPPCQVRVIAGPAPFGRTFDRQDVCRLIDIDPLKPELTLESVPASFPGRASRAGKKLQLSYMSAGAATAVRTRGLIAVDGATVGVVYQQLIANVQAAGGKATNVTCRIGTSPTDLEISALYPGFSLPPEEQLRRFCEVVEWWQHPALVGAADQPAFTHGARIQRYNGHLDQLAKVAAVLRTDSGSSRGVVVLLSPSADNIADLDNEFPSFCLAQFFVRVADGSSWLECVAYFRKQEVRYWWLVNVAEIASLQKRLVKSLTAAGKKDARVREVRAGSITTVAALAQAGTSPPKVQVPKIDRYFTVQRERLSAMVTALLWLGMPGREGYAEEWREVLHSLIPSEERDPDGVAVAYEGLVFLLSQLQQHLAQPLHQNDPELKKLWETLGVVLQQNTLYMNEERRNQVDQQRHAQWRAAVEPLVQEMLVLTCNRMLPASAAGAAGDTGAASTGAES